MVYTVIASELVDGGFRWNDAGGQEPISEPVPHVYFKDENGHICRFELDLYKVFYGSQEALEKAQSKKQWVQPGLKFQIPTYSDGQASGIKWVR